SGLSGGDGRATGGADQAVAVAVRAGGGAGPLGRGITLEGGGIAPTAGGGAAGRPGPVGRPGGRRGQPEGQGQAGRAGGGGRPERTDTAGRGVAGQAVGGLRRKGWRGRSRCPAAASAAASPGRFLAAFFPG